MWLCFMASSPMRAVVRLAWERVFPPSWVRFASPASHRAVGYHALMGYGLPVPFLVVALGMVGTAVSPRHLALPTIVDGQGNRPVNSLHADLAYGPRASVGRRKICFPGSSLAQAGSELQSA